MLFAFAFSAYGISNVVWTYYENWLRMPVPASPVSQFLYLCYDAPIVMALFLREGEDPSGLDWQRSLDFVQMLMVAFLIYYDFLYLRALPRGPHSLEVMEQAMTNVLNFVLAAAFLVRGYWAPDSAGAKPVPQNRDLFHCVCAGGGDRRLRSDLHSGKFWKLVEPGVDGSLCGGGYVGRGIRAAGGTCERDRSRTLGRAKVSDEEVLASPSCR